MKSLREKNGSLKIFFLLEEGVISRDKGEKISAQGERESGVRNGRGRERSFLSLM